MQKRIADLTHKTKPRIGHKRRKTSKISQKTAETDAGKGLIYVRKPRVIGSSEKEVKLFLKSRLTVGAGSANLCGSFTVQKAVTPDAT